MVIVTKVPLCGYYFPDDDEIVWLFATMVYLPCLVCSPFKPQSGVKLWRHPSSHIREKISAGAHFCTKTGRTKTSRAKKGGVKHGLARHFRAQLIFV
ncbi:hypothetical protein [Pectobacterium polaris]|uniref:hypothetical protein n=1 Tax=Pectobacterium polaris TaxID=2042057 RepID=UPI0011C39AC5|nr:hypothetical protein [Pectobacterium polaris]